MNLRQTLTGALEARIERDMGPDRFNPAGWDQIPLGTYYFSADLDTSLIVIHRVVGEVLFHVLAAHGRMLTNAAWHNFY
jgi:hypothetical protein